MPYLIIMMGVWGFFSFADNFSDTSSHPNQSPFFYEIKKDGKSIYALGLMHIPIAVEELSCWNNIHHHLQNSSLFFLEHDVPTILDIALYMLNKEKEPLELGFYDLNPESQQFFITQFPLLQSLLDLPESTLRSASVTRLQFMLFLLCLLKKPNTKQWLTAFINTGVLDHQVKSKAQSYNIPIRFLDSFLYNTSYIEQVINQIRENTTVLDIENMIKQYQHTCNHFIGSLSNELYIYSLKDLFKANDLSFINALWATDHKVWEEQGFSPQQIKELTDSVKQKMLKNRNLQWVLKIQQAYYETDGDIFISAGVGHLVDSYNILDMLKTQGFSVTQFNSSCSFQ